MEKITPCISSELALFDEQQYQNIIRDSDYGYYGANLTVANTPIIEIAKSDKYCDLSKSFLAGVVKIYKIENDVEKIPIISDQISITNNFIGTAFKQIQIKLDDKDLENSNSTYAIEDYIRTTLNEPRDTKETFLQNQVYYADSPGQFDNFGITLTEEVPVDSNKPNETKKIIPKIVNNGFMARRQLILDGSGEFEMRGRVGSGFFNCGKLLLKQTKLTLILTKNDDSFAILGNKDFRFKFVKLGLWVKHVIPNDEIQNSINMRITTSPIFYNTINTKVTMVTFDGKTNEFSTRVNTENIVPNKLIVCFADSDGIQTGNFLKNPFNFQSYSITQIDLREGTSSFPYTTALSFDFENNKYLDGYYTLFNGIEKPSQDSHIDRNAYKNGYFFVVFDLRHSEDCPEYKEYPRSEALNLRVSFKSPPNKPISVICYQEYNQTIKIQVQEDGSKIITK